MFCKYCACATTVRDPTLLIYNKWIALFQANRHSSRTGAFRNRFESYKKNFLLPVRKIRV